MFHTEPIEKQIRNLIPHKLNQFRKLRDGEPYLFDKWAYDREGRFCLYYIVTGGRREYKKRVLMKELIKAATQFNKKGEFNRSDFKELCPITMRDGSCGYAIIVRILESLYKSKDY